MLRPLPCVAALGSLAAVAACGAPTTPLPSTATPVASATATAAPPVATGSVAEAPPAEPAPVPPPAQPVPLGPLPATDAHGDPLPTGARRRLGTLRHRGPSSGAQVRLPDQGPLTAWVTRNNLANELDITTGQTLRTMKNAGWGTIQAPLGRSFVFVPWDEKVQKRDLSGKVLRAFAMPPGSPAPGTLAAMNVSLGFVASDDGSRVAVWARGRVIIYDTASGATVGRHDIPLEEGHQLEVVQVVGHHVVVRDEESLLSMNREVSVAVWDLEKRRERFSVDGDVSLSADGRHAAVYERTSGEIQFRTIGGKVLERASVSTPHKMGPLHLSGDGTRLAWHQADSIHIYSTQPLEELETAGAGEVRALSPNGQRMAVERNGFVHVVSTSNVELPDPPAGHTDRITQLAFSPDGRTVSTLSARGWRMWNAVTGAPERHVHTPSPRDEFGAIAIGANRVAAIQRGNLLVSRPNEVVPTEVVAKGVEAFALGDDGFAALHGMSSRDDQRIAWYDYEGRERWSIEVDGVNHLAVTPHHVLGSGYEHLGALDRATGQLTSQVRGVSGAMTVVGDRVFVDSYGVVEVDLDQGNLRPLRRIPDPRDGDVAVSANGQRFAFEEGGAIFIHDAKGIVGQILAGRTSSPVTALAFSPDGGQLATGAYDGTVLLWDLRHVSAWKPVAKPMPQRPVGTNLRQADPHCLIDERGAATCRGLSGKLPGARDLHELRVTGYGRYACASAGAHHKLQCWRRGSRGGPFVTAAVPALTDVEQLAVRNGGGCAIHSGGKASCWDRPIGIGAPKGNTSWTLASDVAELGMGLFFVCFRKKGDGSVWCGGSGREVLGSTIELSDAPPRKLEGLGRAAIDLAVANKRACAVLDDRTVRCWGRGENFTLGDGTGLSTATPVKVPGIDDATSVQLSEYVSCALTQKGEAWCWGQHPRLGSGLGVAAKPERVATGVDELGGGDGICLRRGQEWSCL